MEAVTKKEIEAKKAELIEAELIKDSKMNELKNQKMEFNEASKILNPLWDKIDSLKREIDTMNKRLLPEVNDGVTVCLWSDREAYTVVSVAKNGKSFYMTRDKTTLDPSFKIDFVPGGFLGHVRNNEDQTYIYESNPEGHKVKVTLRKNGTWKIQGESQKGSTILIGVRSKFHDYNF